MEEKVGNVIITLGFSYIFDFFLHFHYNYKVFFILFLFFLFSSLPRRLERTVPMDCTTKYSLEEKKDGDDVGHDKFMFCYHYLLFIIL